MSLFNLPVVHEEKEVSHHPWEKTVKDLNSHKIKYAHNSVHNPPYPKKKEKERAPEKDRVRFTVIGNRVTKEFIYCAKMVQGVHKYRSKIYDPPVVKGVTSVEWPSVLNNLKVEYGGLAYCLNSQVAVLRNDKFFGGEKELRDLIESEYIYHLTIDYHKESVNQFASFVKASERSFAYMHITIDSKHIGTFIFMLYTDIVPRTCENFLRLCKTRKGGYSGTPVHRIVKDGWIQCGGFGLKSVDMDCENFIVPHDRRGVLAMANDGSHVDCSTQFFVLLQPAHWMQSKYVAFGQLVDGESTLKAIEEIPTWYESPRAEIIIHKAGILNIDCQDIMINPGAKAYIDGHIDDLITIGEIFYEALMEQVFLEIEFRRIARMEQKGEEEEEEEHKADDAKHKEDIRATQRFMRRKDEIHNQLRKLHRESKRPSSTHSKAPSEKSNKEFDVDVYEFEPEAEEYIYPQSPVPSISEPPREKRPFYIPLTDVPYPEEVSSEYDLKKFLKGDYCLESDLAPTDDNRKVILAERKWSYNSDIFNFFGGDEDDVMQREDLDSDEEEEIKQYLKENADRVSFAGAVIKEVAKGVGMVNLFEDHRKSELITDEVLRRFRIASMDMRAAEDNKRVSISIPLWERGTTTKIKRRQTGFVRPEDLAKIRKLATDKLDIEEEETESPFPKTDRKVSVSINMPDGASEIHDTIKRRQTGFVRPQDLAKIRLFKKGSADDDDDKDDDEDNEEPDTNERLTDNTSERKRTGTEVEEKVKPWFEDTEPEAQRHVDSNGTRPIFTKEEIVEKPQMTKNEESEDTDDDSGDNERVPDLGSTRSATTSTVSIKEPFGSKEVHDKIKRRQTGFVKPEELEHIREFIKDSVHDTDENDEDDEERGPVPQLSGTRSKTTSAVSINVPMDAQQKHEKIKRRQTGFVKPEELAQIREFVKDKDIHTGPDDLDEDDKVKKTEVKLPEDAEEKYNKVKRRQTSFVKSGVLAKIRALQGDDEEEMNNLEEEVQKDLEYEDEDDQEPIPEISRSKAKTASTVSITVPIESREIHARIKRRQTGFVKSEELAQIREFVKDQDIGTGYDLDKEDKSKKTEVKLPEEAEERYNRVKRRQTSFVKSGALSKIRALERDGENEEQDITYGVEGKLGEYEDEEEQYPTSDLSGMKSKTASTVSLNIPFNSKEEHDKIKRRQTGFVKPEELAQIREFAKDLVEDEKKTGVKLPEDAEEKYNKVKRRQTSFVKPGALSKILDFQGEGEIEGEEVKNDQKYQQYEDEDEELFQELSGTKSKTTSTVSISIPFGSKEVHDKIKRRQTGFVKPEELAKIHEFVKDQDIDTGNELEENEEEKRAGVKLPDDAEVKYNKVKRRQTSFVKPGALANIRERESEEIEEEEQKIYQDNKRDEDEKDTIPELSGAKSKTTSTVSINVPFESTEEHDKIRRRPTAFVKPEELTHIREFVKDEEIDTGYDFVNETEVNLQDDIAESYKRRQTSFAKPDVLSKIREFSKYDETEEEDGKEDLGQTRNQCAASTVFISEPEDTKTHHEKIKRRQTGFVSKEQLTKIREFIKDEPDSDDQEDDAIDIGKSRKAGPSAVVISEPEGAKTIHDKFKRRQTGFVSPDQLTNIREFVKDLDEDEKAVVIQEPEGAKEVHEKFKRRQTGFVKPQEAAKLRGEVDDDDDDDNWDYAFAEQDCKEPGSTEPTKFEEASKNAKKRRQTSFVAENELNKVREFTKDEQIDEEVDLSTTRSQGPSIVSISEPEGVDKVHDKIKRRQTGFVSPDQLTKIREFVKDEIDDDEEGEQKAGHKGVIISEPEGAKTVHEKIKRRQTGYVKPEEAAKLRAMAKNEEVNEDEDKNNVKNKTKDRHGLVEIREPDGSKEKSEKIKRRQTGFFKPQDLILDEDDCDKENNPDTNNRRVSVSIVAPDSSDKQSHIKRRQTGFVRPQDVAKILKMADDNDEDDDGDDDDGDARKSSDSNDTNLKSRDKKESHTAEYSDDVTACALFVTFKGRDHREYKEHRKVRIIHPSGGTSSPNRKIVLPPERVESDTEMRKSLLARLYEEVKKDDDVLPTLKAYRPKSESQQQKNILLTFSQNQLSVEPDARNDKYFRPSITVEESFEQVLNLQHGKKVTRKISSDYVNTIDQIERRPENSIRSMEYAKTRPAMTVAEYQKKNRLYQEERKRSNDLPSRGIRLPGDTPLYAQSPIGSSHHLAKKRSTFQIASSHRLTKKRSNF